VTPLKTRILIADDHPVVLNGLRTVLNAQADLEVVAQAMERARAGETAPRQLLTPREDEVVKLIAEAYTNDEIAGMLQISKKTVERHRANILDKLGMRDRVELTRYAIRRGLVEP
jgi:DNA-binding NarL/FixJ family response regulator